MRAFYPLLVLITTLLGCSSSEVETIVHDVRLSPKVSWQLELGQAPAEGRIYVSKEPTHAILSVVKADSVEGELVYLYQPIADYEGSDFVEIIRESSIGNEHLSPDVIHKVHIVISE